jgi:hypothetical protein
MPLEIKKDNTYHRADGSVVFIGFSGPYKGTSFVVYRESASSEECWTSGGNNFPGGTVAAKCLTGWVHPAIAAKLKSFDGKAPAPAPLPAKLVFEYDPATDLVRKL